MLDSNGARIALSSLLTRFMKQMSHSTSKIDRLRSSSWMLLGRMLAYPALRSCLCLRTRQTTRIARSVSCRAVRKEPRNRARNRTIRRPREAYRLITLQTPSKQSEKVMLMLLKLIKKGLTRCLIVHPVLTKDATRNQVLAEEAVGLASSLGWMVTDLAEKQSTSQSQWTNPSMRRALAEDSQFRVRSVSVTNYFTKGKLQEIGEQVKEGRPDVLFVNTQLTAIQAHNIKASLERHCGTSPHVFDRFTVILQIFAQRHKSESTRKQLQICLLRHIRTQLIREGNAYISAGNVLGASLEELIMRRLDKMEVVSARGRKMPGTLAGEGETQLQIERRMIKDKEMQLSREIEHLQKKRKTLRYSEPDVPKVSIIGYTNSGKSSLLNILIKKEEAVSKDCLFQTLELKSRALYLASGFKVVFIDTVGFIQDLPTALVEAFRSTLEDALQADIVIHLVDASSPNMQQQRQTVVDTIGEAAQGRLLEVWNKIDLLPAQLQGQECAPSILRVSCVTRQGIKQLLKAVESKGKSVKSVAPRRLKYCLTKHENRKKWLQRVGHCTPYDQAFCYTPTEQFPDGWVQFTVDLNEVIYNKFITYLEGRTNRRQGRGMPGEEWASQ